MKESETRTQDGEHQCGEEEAAEHPRQPVSNRAEPPRQGDPCALQTEHARAQ